MLFATVWNAEEVNVVAAPVNIRLEARFVVPAVTVRPPAVTVIPPVDTVRAWEMVTPVAKAVTNPVPPICRAREVAELIAPAAGIVKLPAVTVIPPEVTVNPVPAVIVVVEEISPVIAAPPAVTASEVPTVKPKGIDVTPEVGILIAVVPPALVRARAVEALGVMILVFIVVGKSVETIAFQPGAEEVMVRNFLVAVAFGARIDCPL